MQRQLNNSTKRQKVHNPFVRKSGARGEAKYKNVCSFCEIPNSKNLIRIRRAAGDIYLCQAHARAAGVI